MTELAPLAPHALSAFPADLAAAVAELALAPGEVIDLGLGDSSEPVPGFIRAALVDAVAETTSYPSTVGLPELREACAGWAHRRFGAELDPETEVQPTQGSKEAVFALGLITRAPGKDLVALTTPGYAIPERGARIAGLEPVALPLTPDRGFLPDLDALDEGTWDRLAVFWLNSPNNPTGAVAPGALLAELAARARRHGFVLAADEAYSEIYRGHDAPPSVLELGDVESVLAFHSLSKRSGLTGYRSGFVAGDARHVAAIRSYRAMAGLAAPSFVQRAAIAAWGDEHHVRERRRALGLKRDALVDGLKHAGIALGGSAAGLFLWAAAPDGDADGFARALIARGVAVVPGRYFGPGGEGWFRLAPVPRLEDCQEAAKRIEAVASEWTS